MINRGEILIANGAGLLVLLFAILSRIEGKGFRHLSDRLFDLMIGITLGALGAETLSFLVDGVYGDAIHILQRALNGYLFFASSSVGALWVIYTDLRIYKSRKKLKRWILPVFLPCFAVHILILFDLFGAGLLFTISEANVYHRGPLFALPYLLLMLDYIFSIALAVRAVTKNNHARFFPVHYFVIPCILGTIIQSASYGLSAGWLCVSLAFLFVQMQLYHQNAYIDDLSGLYNRKYYNCVVDKLASVKKHASFSGIMMDINGFKSINDRFGHSAGDDAIRALALLLTETTRNKDVVFRYAGDEFIIISADNSEADTQELISRLNHRIQEYNQTSGSPYQLSISTGYTISDAADFDPDEFLRSMDTMMYKSKAAFYSQSGMNRRRRQDGESAR